MSYELDTTLGNGLEVSVEFTAYYEDGECGYPGYCVEELSIATVGGRKCSAKVSEWLLKRYGEDAIVETCQEYLREY